MVNCARRQLVGKKSFDLMRAHLVKPSGISKGTIYNHFTSEADLVVSVAIAELEQLVENGKQLDQLLSDPFDLYLAHQCQRLQSVIGLNQFAITKVMPNPQLLAETTEALQQRHSEAAKAYQQWNQAVIARMGEVTGYDRYELAKHFIRGTLADLDDNPPIGDHQPVYHQFCYALLQLLGHSAKRPPSQQQIANWLSLHHIDASVH